jgi:hypothetical protein
MARLWSLVRHLRAKARGIRIDAVAYVTGIEANIRGGV